MGKGAVEDNCIKIVKDNIITANLLSITQEEFEHVFEWIKEAIPNEVPSAFPDFIFPNGFIEHFQITSSVETKKGSKAIRDEVDFIRSYERDLKKEIDDNRGKHFPFEKSRSISGHSHDYYLESLKNNVSNHLESLKQFKGKKENGIFMIQYFDNALNMCHVENDGVYKRDYYPYYRLTKDKKALTYLSSIEDKIKYIIFVGVMKKQVDFNRIPIYDCVPFVELVGLTGLKEEINKINDYDIYPNAVNEMSLVTYV